MMEFVIRTIRVDVPNVNGNVYPRRVIEKAIEEFNKRKDKPELRHAEGLADRNILSTKESSCETLGIRIDEEGFVEFRCKTRDNEAGKKIAKLIEEGKVDYLPTIEVPLDQPKSVGDSKVITEITRIRGMNIGEKK